MKKLILVGVGCGLLAGAFFAFRWFRGETAYEQALADLDEEPALDVHMRTDASPA
jgi:uncharacterized membrane protein